MFLTEYNEEKMKEQERQEGRKEGLQEGLQKGRKEMAVEVATDLIKEGGLSASFISKISQLSEDAVRKLAKSMGIAVL